MATQRASTDAISNGKARGATHITLPRPAHPPLAGNHTAPDQRVGVFLETPDAVMVLDFDGRILECNSEAERQVGYSRTALLNANAVSLLLPEGRRESAQATLRAYNACSHGGRLGHRIVCLVQRANGEIFEAHLAVTPISITQPGVLIVSMRADGSQLLPETGTEEPLPWVHSVMNATPIGIALMDLNGYFLRVNAALCRITGYEEPDLLVRSPLDITHPDDLEANVREMARLRRGNDTSREFLTRYVRADGRTIWVRVSGVLLRDAQGKPNYYLAQVQDVNERHEAKIALRRSESMFRAIFENAAVGLARVDIEGHLLQTNAAFQRMVGYSEEELSTIRTSDITHPDDLHATSDYVYAMLDSAQESGTLEKRYIHRNGNVVWARVTWSRVERDCEHGCLDSRLCVIEDITEERLAVEVTQRLASIVESSADAIMSTDRHKIVTSWNRSAERLFGYKAEEIIGRPVSILFPPEKKAEFLDINATLRQGHTLDLNSLRVRADGSLIPVSSVISPILDQNGKVVGASGIVRDISERIETDRILQRYRLLAEAASDVVVFTDEQGIIVEANQAAANLRGCRREELIGQQVLGMILRRDEAPLFNYDRVQEEPVTLETVVLRHNGAEIPMEVRVHATEMDGGLMYMCIGRDISERRDYEQQLARQAFHDGLTGIPNRALFVNRLAHALSRTHRSHGRVAVLFMDLDRFKVLNDSKGHLAGDQLLVAMAALLRSCLRVEDTIARFGGDEFTILLEDAHDEGQATRLAERILRKLQVPFNILGQEVYMTASIGIAFGSAADTSAEEMLRHADLAMYRAKSEGKARYAVYQPHLGVEAEERLRFESELHRAIELDEFHVHYQPVILMETRQVIGVEALARWQHPRFGLMPPDEFVPLQEQIGLIEPFTMWVLRKSLMACQRWHEAGYHLSVSVNLSPYNLHAPGFPEHVAALIREIGFPPSYLKLEITESAVMLDPAQALRVLNQLAAMGIRLSMDDFGTGYSSLSYLKQLPVHEIKIDKSFVMGMDVSDEDDAAIVRATIDLAHNLRKKVVAEGVESQTVWDLLNVLGCDAAQGFHMARPMPEDQVHPWLQSSPWGMPPHTAKIGAV